MSTIAITYTLYRLDGSGHPQPVTTTADLGLQSDLRAKDGNPVVDKDPDAEQQGKLIEDHVNGIFYEYEVADHFVLFPAEQNSRYDPTGGPWDPPLEGASMVFTVYPDGSDPADSKLRLAVATPVE